MSALFDFPQFSQRWHIANIPPDALARCFFSKNESNVWRTEAPWGIFIEVLPTIIVKQSSFEFLSVYIYLFSHCCALDENAKAWIDEVA